MRKNPSQTIEVIDPLKLRGQKAYAPFEAAKTILKSQKKSPRVVDRWISHETGDLDSKHIKDNCGCTRTGTPRLHTIVMMEELAKRLPVSIHFC